MNHQPILHSKCLLLPLPLLLLSSPSSRTLTIPGQRASTGSRPLTTARTPMPPVTILMGFTLSPKISIKLPRVLVAHSGLLTVFLSRTLSRPGPLPLIIISSACPWLLTTQHRCKDPCKSGISVTTRDQVLMSSTPVNN